MWLRVVARKVARKLRSKMLSKEFRLRKKADIDVVYKKGQTLANAKLAFRFSPNSLSTSRVAVLVGKKLEKSAVGRNRIRRRLREVIRLNFLQIPAGFDLLVIARDPKLREIDFVELNSEFLNLLSKWTNKSS